MYDKIKSEIVNAMKEKDTFKLQTLRGIKGDADMEHINKKVEINDELMINVLSRGIKTRKESIAEFEKGGRDDLIEKTNEEIELLQTFLPKQLSSDEVEKIIDDVFKKVNVLSGGEKARCMLSKIMLEEPNFLILDEPTNHLDLESITSLNKGLCNFTGEILFTSRDYELNSTVANRVIEIMDDGKIVDRSIPYEEYLEKKK